jgi:hypothetical protein
MGAGKLDQCFEVVAVGVKYLDQLGNRFFWFELAVETIGALVQLGNVDAIVAAASGF